LALKGDDEGEKHKTFNSKVGFKVLFPKKGDVGTKTSGLMNGGPQIARVKKEIPDKN